MYGIRSDSGKFRYLGISQRPACYARPEQGNQYAPEAFTPAMSGTENDMHITDYNLPYQIYNYNENPPTSIQAPEILFGFQIRRKSDGVLLGFLCCEALYGASGATGHYVDIRWNKYIGGISQATQDIGHAWWELEGAHADAVDLYVGFFEDMVDGKPIFGVNFTSVPGTYGPESAGYFTRHIGSWIYTNDEDGILLLDPETEVLHYEETDDPNDDNPGDPDRDREGGNSGTGGGGGDHTHHNDIIDIPPFPTLLSGACGFVTLYNPTLANVRALAEKVTSDSVLQWLINFVSEPMQCIAGLGIVPVQPTTSGLGMPKFGRYHIDIAMPVILTQFSEVDCGSIHLTEFYGSALDYSPYTSIQIYLPYIGYRELAVDEIMCYTVSVVYHIDLYNGNCVAFVTLTRQNHRTVRYQFSGNCLQQIPISGQSYDEVVSNGIRIACTAIAGYAAAGAAGDAAMATQLGKGKSVEFANNAAISAEQASISSTSASLTGSTLSSIMSAKPHIERAGNLGGSIGHMGVQKPFIVRTIPRQSIPTNFKHYRGYPSNITYRISELDGYTVMDSVRLVNIPATDTEIAEIYNILSNGFIA